MCGRLRSIQFSPFNGVYLMFYLDCAFKRFLSQSVLYSRGQLHQICLRLEKKSGKFQTKS